MQGLENLDSLAHCDKRAPIFAGNSLRGSIESVELGLIRIRIVDFRFSTENLQELLRGRFWRDQRTFYGCQNPSCSNPVTLTLRSVTNLAEPCTLFAVPHSASQLSHRISTELVLQP